MEEIFRLIQEFTINPYQKKIGINYLYKIEKTNTTKWRSKNMSNTPEEKAVYVIDIETTGFDPVKDSVVEIAVVKFCLEECKYSIEFNELVKPECPIGFGAMGVHNITEEMVVDKRPWKEVKEDVNSFLKGKVPVAHNAVFESAFLADNPREITRDSVPPVGWIDTMILAKHQYHDLDSHALASLRYSHNVLMNDKEIEGYQPHRALFDTILTGKLLCGLSSYGATSIENLIRDTQKPILLKKCNFGKYKGKNWVDIARIDYDYLCWVVKKGDFDRNTINTCLHYINNYEPPPPQITNF